MRLTRVLAFVPVEPRLRLRVRLFAPLRDKVTPASTSIDPGSLGHRHLKHNTAGSAVCEATYVGATNGKRGRRATGWGGYFRAAGQV
jgi:hypothetical protein